MTLFFLGFSQKTNANHILGGEVHYEWIKDKQYKVFVKVYRDCQECKLGTYGGGSNTSTCPDVKNLELRNAKTGSLLSTLALKRDGFKDITPVCKTSQSICSNSQGINYGIEEHSFSVVVNLASYTSVCNFEFGLKLFSRSKSLSNETFYNYARLNICDVSNNNSASFNAAPLQVLYLNEPVRYSLEASDEDGDSLSYALVKAKKDHDKDMSYMTPTTEIYPLSVKCSSTPCVPNKSANPPEGVSFSTSSGELVFTPNKLDEIGVFVIEVKEWRKINGVMKLVGITRSDVQFVVVNSLGNLPPKIINTERSYSVCAGEELCIDYNAYNNSKGPSFDSVYFSCNTQIKDYKFYIHKFKIAPYFGSTFCWKTSSKDVRDEPYTYTIKLQDDGCPISKASYYTFSVRVYNSVYADLSVKNVGCGKLDLKAIIPNEVDHSYYWEVLNEEKTVIDYLFAKDSLWEAPNNGKYYFNFVYTNDITGCNVLVQDSILVQNISSIEVGLASDKILCKGSTYTITSTVKGASGVVDYLWGHTPIKKSFVSGVLDTTRIFSLIVEDEFFCKDTATYRLETYPLLQYALEDKELCSSSKTLVLNDEFIHIGPANISFKTFGKDTIALQEISNVWRLKHHLFSAPKIFELYAHITDRYSCVYLDTMKVEVNDPPLENFTSIRTICANESSFNLDRESQNNLEGTWSFKGYESNLKDNEDILVTGLIPNRKYDVSFVYSKNGCTVNKDLSFYLAKLPEVKIRQPNLSNLCVSSNPIACLANQQTGTWRGKGLVNEIFHPSLVNQDSSVISVEYLDPNTMCTNMDSITIHIVQEPEVEIRKDKDTLCEGEQSEFIIRKKYEEKVELDYLAVNKRIYGNTFVYNSALHPGVNTVKVFATASNSYCPSSSDSLELRIIDLPKGRLLPTLDKGCEPFDFDFVIEDGNYQLSELSFHLKGEGVSGNSMSVNGLKEGVYDYSVDLSKEGCVNNLRYNGVEVFSSPISSFTVNPFLIFADFPVAYLRNTSQSKDSFSSQWLLPNSISSREYREDLIVDYPDEIATHLVQLNVQTVNGCFDSSELNVRILPSRELHIPSAFTPNQNGPGKNERFKVYSTVSGSYSIKILNRWGEIMYTSTNINDSWDGNYNGAPCKPGVYAYRIVVRRNDGYTKFYNGTVALIRAGSN